MKPSSRIQATIDIFEREQTSRVPLDTCVGDYMRVRRYIGSKDRAEIAQRVFNMARAHARLGWWMERASLDDTPRHRVLAWLILGEGIDLKRSSDLFDGTKYSPEPLADHEKNFVMHHSGQALLHTNMPEAVRCECPPQHEERLRTLFGDKFCDEMVAMLEPATLDLRVNVFLATKDKVRAFLEADGVETVETPYSPWGLRCTSKAFLSRTKAFSKGWIEIQDEGSQLIAHVCGVEPGMQVLDYCAGAGGKTLALAAAMQRKGRIVAMDLDERRLMKGRERYKKAQLADIIEVRPLSEERHKKWLRRQKETFDLVLLDVPCSGTGTWRRNPDMRWRTYGPTLEDLMPMQAEIMDKIVHAVKPGGRLVYATCSLLREENENQVYSFIERHPEFETVPLDQSLGLGTPFLRLSPMRHKTDGFFAAVLQKKLT